MGKSRLAVDSTITARLGSRTMAELRRGLWAVDCQTCGGAFGRCEKPALLVEAEADAAVATLHHRACRTTAWLDRPASSFPHVTWRGSLIVLPTGKTPMYLINPYFELALLSRDGAGWRVSTLDPFAGAGMGTDLWDGVVAQPSVRVHVRDDVTEVSVTDGAGVRHSWPMRALAADDRAVFDTKEWITVAVTSELDLRRTVRRNPMPALIKTERVRLAAAWITYSRRAQALRDTDFPDDTLTELLAVGAKAIENGLGLTASREVLTAAIACCSGEPGFFAGLDRQDRMIGSLLVTVPYVSYARRHAYRAGMHVMVPEESDAASYGPAFARFGATLGLTVTNLNADDPVGDDAGEVLIGTPEAFLDRYAYLTDDDRTHHTPGVVALAIGEATGDRAASLLAHYPRAAIVG